MNRVSEWEDNPDTYSHGIFFASFVLFFVGLALFFALLYGQTDLSIFSLIIIILAAGLKVWSSYSVKSLRYQVSIDKQKVFPGEKIDFKVLIENNKFLPVLVKIRLSLPQSLLSGKQDLLIAKDSGLLWYQKIAVHRELTPAKRGLYKTGSPRLITGDFFGFFPRQTGMKQEVDVLVFPQLIALQPFPLLSRIMFGKQSVASPIHDPVHILGTRDYQSYSSARNIHWKATARHFKLQEKIFEATEQEKIIIILEIDGFLCESDEQAFERTIEVIASLALELDTHHYAVGFLTNSFIHDKGSHHLLPARTPDHLSVLLVILAKIDFRSTCTMAELLKKKSYVSPGTTLLYFSYQPIRESTFLTQGKIPLINIISHDNTANLPPGKHGSPLVQTRLLKDLYKVN